MIFAPHIINQRQRADTSANRLFSSDVAIVATFEASADVSRAFSGSSDLF